MLGRLRRAKHVLEEAEEAYTSVADRDQTSLARDAVIAAIDPASGKLWNNCHWVVAGALLVELAREGRLDVSDTGKKTRVTVRDATPLGDKQLDAALLTIATGVLGHKATRLVHGLPSDDDVLGDLVAAGVVTEESSSTLGFSVRRYRPTSSAGRDELVARLRSALLGESVPDERTALLISTLTIGVHLKLFVPRKQIGEAYRRAEEILERIGDDERALVSAAKAARGSADGSSSSI